MSLGRLVGRRAILAEVMRQARQRRRRSRTAFLQGVLVMGEEEEEEGETIWYRLLEQSGAEGSECLCGTEG